MESAVSYAGTGRMTLKLAVCQRPCDGGNILSWEDGQVHVQAENEARSSFEVDHMQPGSASSEETYDKLGAPLVQQVLSGYDALCIVAGQAGSGKSYTLFGESRETRGLMPRACEHLFARIEERRDTGTMKISCKLSLLAVKGNNVVKDLGMSLGGMKVASVEPLVDNSLGSYVVNEVTHVTVASYEDVMRAWRQAKGVVSQEFDVVMDIKVTQSFKTGAGKTVHSHLVAVELGNPGGAVVAGPSREALAAVVAQLTQKVIRANVPFASSKLTHVLHERLSGSCLLLLIAQLWPTPENAAAARETLQFVSSCRARENSEEETARQQIRKLTLQVQRLEADLETTHAYYQKMIEGVLGAKRAKQMGAIERATGANLGASGMSTPGTATALSKAGSRRGSVDGGGLGATERSLANIIELDDIQERLQDMAAPSVEEMKGTLNKLEGRTRVLEAQLEASRQITAELEGRMQHKHMEMEDMSEKHMAKEHAQFKENKRLNEKLRRMEEAAGNDRVAVQARIESLTAELEAEQARGKAEADGLRKQLAELSSSIHGLVDGKAAQAAARQKEKEELAAAADAKVRAHMGVVEAEKKTELEGLRSQHAAALEARDKEIGRLREASHKATMAATAAASALQEELRYLLDFAASSLSYATAPPPQEPAVGSLRTLQTTGGLINYAAPPRTPALQLSKLPYLKAQPAAAPKLQAIASALSGSRPGTAKGSQAGSSRPGSARPNCESSQPATPKPAAGSISRTGEPLMDALGAAAVERDGTDAAAALDDGARQLVESLQAKLAEAEAAAGRYRQEVVAERRKAADLLVALRSVQRGERAGLVAHEQSISNPLMRAPSMGVSQRPNSAMPAMMSSSLRSSLPTGTGLGLTGPAAGTTMMRGMAALGAAQQKAAMTASAKSSMGSPSSSRPFSAVA